MITSLFDYQDPIYSTNYTDQFNGTVYITVGEASGTGTLLNDGKTILTAAHVLEHSTDNRATVSFDSADGSYSIDGNIIMHEGYSSTASSYDVALISLDTNAPLEYLRYELYKDSDELGQDFTMVGYGTYGSGYTGMLSDETDILKLKTQNTFEIDLNDIDNSLIDDSILGADFDDGTQENDYFGNRFDINHTGLGDMEGMIASGDSGGPAFIDGKVAGIASFGYTEEGDPQSVFGDIGGWHRVSYFQDWIDTNMRSTYENTPNSIQETQTTVEETDSDTITTTFFYLQFDRANINSDITLQYTTRDGNATAGEDYIAKSGTVTLYANENSVAIPVEIIGDDQVEGDELFYLDITNPSYSEFNGNIDTLIASRIISDNDSVSQNALDTTLTYYTTQNYIQNTFGLTMQTAADAILSSIEDLNTIYDIFVQYNINNDMIADVLHSRSVIISGDEVSQFLTTNNLNGGALGTYYDDTYFIA